MDQFSPNSYLLDTNIFIWLTQDKSRLKANTIKLLKESYLYLSPISILEIKIKISIGKLRYTDNILDMAKIHDIELLDLSGDQIDNYKIFSATNKDPFDNTLLTIAKSNKLMFLSADNKIAKLSNSLSWVVNGRL